MNPEMAAAVVAAFAELGHVPKDGTGHHGKYATIGSVLDHARPILAKHGLAVVQCPGETEPGTVRIVTSLVHTSGETFTDDGLRMPAPNDPQKVGGVVSYARRYALMTFLGLAPVDDDDAHAASEQIRKEEAQTHANSQRVTDVLAALKALAPDEKDAVKAWADGRSLAPKALLADEAWLGRVEQFISELTS